jgi:hypothetical protein
MARPDEDARIPPAVGGLRPTRPAPSREVVKATCTGFAAAGALLALVFVGSRELHHFDAALFAYLFATLFATFGIAYRYSMWLQRPPTKLYWKRGWQMFLRPGRLRRNLLRLGDRVTRRFALNDFIWKRNRMRGLAHVLIMWGCLLAFAITFPLVFGWIHFETVDEQFQHYRIVLFGFPTIPFRIGSLLGYLLFHGLVWSSFIVIAGVMLAFRRRMREHGAAAVQRFGEDILPLIMLFAISVTGLLIWASYRWMHGYAYSFLAILHAITVILFLLWMPFGKFFHIFQRLAQLGVSFYKDAGADGEQARCARCGEAYAAKLHIDDLIEVEKQLGYCYELPDASGDAEHYQRFCPKCRRSMLAIAQGQLWAAGRTAEPFEESMHHGESPG